MELNIFSFICFLISAFFFGVSTACFGIYYYVTSKHTLHNNCGPVQSD